MKHYFEVMNDEKCLLAINMKCNFFVEYECLSPTHMLTNKNYSFSLIHPLLKECIQQGLKYIWTLKKGLKFNNITLLTLSELNDNILIT